MPPPDLHPTPGNLPRLGAVGVGNSNSEREAILMLTILRRAVKVILSWIQGWL
jgi:hypothetical protein